MLGNSSVLAARKRQVSNNGTDAAITDVVPDILSGADV